MSTEAVTVETVLEQGHDQGVRLVTMNRPETLNSFNEDMIREFRSELMKLKDDSRVRALVLTGAGRAFSSGGDFAWLQARVGRDASENESVLYDFYDAFIGSVTRLPYPTIAAINGHAVGAGFGLALGCDLRLAAQGAKLGINFVRLGLPPGMGTSLTLPLAAGQQVASRMLLTGELLTSEAALDHGLVLKVLPQSEVVPHALALARTIAAASPVAVRASVAALRQRAGLADLEAVLRAEARVQARCFLHPDTREGLAAAAAKRDPRFGDA